ncbi:MAG: hypothetical protein AB1556_07540 [Bacillota bacterium]
MWGHKIIDGAVYSTLVRSGMPESTGPYVELAPSGYLNVIGPRGKKTLDVIAGADQGTIRWFEDNASNERVQFATIALNGAVTRDLWVCTWENNGILLSADVGGSISIGPTAGVNRQGIYIGGRFDDCDLNPYTTGTGSVGTNTYKWFSMRASYITPDDICFRETACAICGQPFTPGDILMLLVHTIHEELGTMCIPIHERCKDTPAEITVKVPEVETRYHLNEKGEVIPYQAIKTETVKEEIQRVKKGFRFDETTGKFFRKAVKKKKLRQDVMALDAPHGRQFTRNGYPIDPLDAFEEVETEPKRPATKEEALETVTVERRRPVYKAVTVKIGTSETN